MKDVLTSYFCSSFKNSGDEKGELVKTPGNIFVENVSININDEFSVFEGQYYTPEKLLSLLNEIVEKEELDKPVKRFVKAARLFRNGIKLEDLSRTAVSQGVDYAEVVMVAYMSVLEVLSIDDEVEAKNLLKFTDKVSDAG